MWSEMRCVVDMMCFFFVFVFLFFLLFFFVQAEDGIRDLVRSRGLGDVYKRQRLHSEEGRVVRRGELEFQLSLRVDRGLRRSHEQRSEGCLLYTSDAADERSSVDLGGRRIIKKKKNEERGCTRDA